MKKYYLEVKSLKKVAKKFKCCYKTVRKYINPISKYSNSEENENKRKKNMV